MEGCPPGSPQWLPELPLTLALSYIWTPPPLASSQDLETSEREVGPGVARVPSSPPSPLRTEVSDRKLPGQSRPLWNGGSPQFCSKAPLLQGPPTISLMYARVYMYL